MRVGREPFAAFPWPVQSRSKSESQFANNLICNVFAYFLISAYCFLCPGLFSKWDSRKLLNPCAAAF